MNIRTVSVRIFFALLGCLLFLPPLAAQNDPNQKEWIQLFNGKDLNDWVVKIKGYDLGDNFGNTFRVEDGLLKVSYDHYDKLDGRYGHIFYKKKFSYYIIAAEYRFVGEQVAGGAAWAWRNNGIMVHCQAPETMTKEQDYPISIEVQLLGGHETGERPNANVCTPGTNIVMDGKLVTTHCVSSTAQTYRGDQWVRVEAMVLGDSVIRHIVDGKTVISYEMPQIGGGSVNNYDPAVKQDGKLLTGGYIALQSESAPTEFRKVELLNMAGCMDPKAKNYKTYYVKAENETCQY
jgi:3-keto-disaccharide hydrolase